MEIVPGVHSIDSLGTGRAYLVADADRLTLTLKGVGRSGTESCSRPGCSRQQPPAYT